MGKKQQQNNKGKKQQQNKYGQKTTTEQFVYTI